MNGGRVKSQARLAEGQTVRIPPIEAQAAKPLHMTTNTIRDRSDEDVLRAMLLYEDEQVLVFDKAPGLAVQGGSGINRSVDSMLEAWRDRKGQKPRLVHRLDRDTSGVLVVARTRRAAQELTKAFRERTTRKLYWALVFGAPRKRSGRISTFLLKEHTTEGDRMRIAAHGEPGADHAVSEYRVIDANPRAVSWLELVPHTGRTHQLRVHAQSIGHPIVGDAKYLDEAGRNRRAACSASCISMRDGWSYRTRSKVARPLTSPRPCHRTCARAGTCSGSTRRTVWRRGNERHLPTARRRTGRPLPQRRAGPTRRRSEALLQGGDRRRNGRPASRFGSTVARSARPAGRCSPRRTPRLPD